MKDQTQLKKTLFILFMVIMSINIFILMIDAFFFLQLNLNPAPIITIEITEAGLNPETIDTEVMATQTPQVEWSATPENGTPETEETLATSTPEPSSTATPIVQNGEYTVQSGDTLQKIAGLIGIAPEDLRKANQMVGDTVLTGQTLNIPPDGVFVREEYRFSPLFEPQFYSEQFVSNQSDQFPFDLHVIPGQYPQSAMPPLYTVNYNALSQVVTFYHEYFDTTFDIYIAGTLFETNHNLRSASDAADSEVIYLLFDGTGNPEDFTILTTCELARFVQASLFGEIPSPLLNEGAATYISLTTSPFNSERISLQQVCKAYSEADVLPDLRDPELAFANTNTDLRNFYTAGCFFDYLYTTSDIDTIKDLYQTDNYPALFGKPFEELVTDFEAWLQGMPLDERTKPVQYVSLETELTSLYQTFMPVFEGSEEQIQVYRELDIARIALHEGRYEDANNHLLIAKLTIENNGWVTNDAGGGGGAPDQQTTPNPTSTKIAVNITITPPVIPTQNNP